jgi:hypothetical protein
MRKNFNILIYYHRNVKKFSTLTILRFILDIQQRLIGAIFLLIVLVKDIPVIICVYWSYIIYFYVTPKDAKQLQITNYFIMGITLLQYFIVLMRQTVVDGNESPLLISYINRVITGQKPADFEANFGLIFKILGIVQGTTATTLLFDSIPTVMFQITIFYYDFFLLYCAERIETFILKVRKEIFFVRKDEYGRDEYMINFKEWKDPLGRLLNSIISVSTVRLMEIAIAILLVLNIYQGKLIWNFIRLIILFMIYSNVAFRPMTEIEVVRGRLKFILSLSIMYLWLRVVTISLIAIDIALVTNSSSVSNLLGILNIESFEKLILVIEFFMMEYISSIYFSKAYQSTVNKLLEKKMVRSTLVGQCITYDANEEKLMRYIEGFAERIALEKDIADLKELIDDWKRGKVSARRQSLSHDVFKNPLSGNPGEQSDFTAREIYELRNKENLMKLSQTSSLKSKIIFNSYKFLLDWRNKFLFSNMIVLYDHIMMRNHEIIQNKELKLRAYLAGSYDIMMHNLNNIKSIYHDYVEYAVKQEHTTVTLPEVLRIAKQRQESRDVMSSIMPAITKIAAGSISMVRERRTRSKQSQAQRQNMTARYNLKILKLNTDYPGMDAQEGRHVFYNILEEDEKITNDYQKVSMITLLKLSYQALLSNWHYICYILMLIYTFVNGGLNGFICANSIVVFVLVEEDLPGIVFWKTCFFNLATAFWMKQLLNGFIQQLVDSKITSSASQEYFKMYSDLIFGSASYIFEIFIMIFLLIELVLLDELGMKKKKMIEYEDTNESFIRMKINKNFEIRENEKFKFYVSYLYALYEGTKLDKSEEGTTLSKDKKKSTKKNQSLIRGTEAEKDEIKIEEVIEYEKDRNNLKTDTLNKTIKVIENNIFVKSFGRVTEENRKSFLWQLFTVYVNFSY